MSAPGYIPVTYQRHRASEAVAGPVHTGAVQLNRSAVCKALADSETSSITVALSSHEKIAAFVAAAESFFEPQLLELLNEWATADNKEWVRDCLTFNGKTASTLMWRSGMSFLDMLCTAQKDLQRPMAQREYKEILISSRGPQYYGDPLIPAPKEGLIKTVKRALFGPRHDVDSWWKLPPNPAGLAVRNKEILCAEQLLKNSGSELEEIRQTCDILRSRKDELTEQLEQDAAMMEAYGKNEKIPPVTRLNDKGLAVAVIMTPEAMTLRRIQLERVEDLLIQLGTEENRRRCRQEETNAMLTRMRLGQGTIAAGTQEKAFCGNGPVESLLKALDTDCVQKPGRLEQAKLSRLLEMRAQLDALVASRKAAVTKLDSSDHELHALQGEYDRLWGLYGPEIDREITENVAYRVLSQRALRADISKRTTYNRIKEELLFEQRKEGYHNAWGVERDNASLDREIVRKRDPTLR